MERPITKIGMINGSPKLGKNTSSGFMLSALETFISKEHEITNYNINKASLTDQQYSYLCECDALIFAFPLYWDAIPSHLLRMMIKLESYMKTSKRDINIYVAINNGFYEGEQSHIAIDIIKNWCERCGLNFGGGFGQGAGEMIGSLEKVPLGHGPLNNLGVEIEKLATSIQEKKIQSVKLFSPNFPRFAWRFMATHLFWNQTAKKNGLKKSDILTKVIKN